MQKSLSNSDLKKILETTNERDLFMVGHIYIENTIDKILEIQLGARGVKSSYILNKLDTTIFKRFGNVSFCGSPRLLSPPVLQAHSRAVSSHSFADLTAHQDISIFANGSASCWVKPFKSKRWLVYEGFLRPLSGCIDAEDRGR